MLFARTALASRPQAWFFAEKAVAKVKEGKLCQFPIRIG
jgi:hypothetical protein